MSGDCGENCLHRANNVQLDDDTPVYSLLAECRRCVDTLKFCAGGITKARRCTRGQHSRRSVVDLPGGGVSDSGSGERAGITRTRLALAQKEYTNDFIFLIHLSFDSDGLVYGLGHAESFFFAGDADRPGFG